MTIYGILNWMLIRLVIFVSVRQGLIGDLVSYVIKKVTPRLVRYYGPLDNDDLMRID
jgi:hypothetical protein